MSDRVTSGRETGRVRGLVSSRTALTPPVVRLLAPAYYTMMFGKMASSTRPMCLQFS